MSVRRESCFPALLSIGLPEVFCSFFALFIRLLLSCTWNLFFNDCIQSIGFFFAGGVVVSYVLERNFYYITLDLFVFQIADKRY